MPFGRLVIVLVFFFIVILCLKYYINFDKYFFINIILIYSCICVVFILFFISCYFMFLSYFYYFLYYIRIISYITISIFGCKPTCATFFFLFLKRVFQLEKNVITLIKPRVNPLSNKCYPIKIT